MGQKSKAKASELSSDEVSLPTLDIGDESVVVFETRRKGGTSNGDSGSGVIECQDRRSGDAQTTRWNVRSHEGSASDGTMGQGPEDGQDAGWQPAFAGSFSPLEEIQAVRDYLTKFLGNVRREIKHRSADRSMDHLSSVFRYHSKMESAMYPMLVSQTAKLPSQVETCDADEIVTSLNRINSNKENTDGCYDAFARCTEQDTHNTHVQKNLGTLFECSEMLRAAEAQWHRLAENNKRVDHLLTSLSSNFKDVGKESFAEISEQRTRLSKTLAQEERNRSRVKKECAKLLDVDPRDLESACDSVLKGSSRDSSAKPHSFTLSVDEREAIRQWLIDKGNTSKVPTTASSFLKGTAATLDTSNEGKKIRKGRGRRKPQESSGTAGAQSSMGQGSSMETDEDKSIAPSFSKLKFEESQDISTGWGTSTTGSTKRSGKGSKSSRGAGKSRS